MRWRIALGTLVIGLGAASMGWSVTNASDPTGDNCTTTTPCGADITQVVDSVDASGNAHFTITRVDKNCETLSFAPAHTQPSITLMRADATSPTQTGTKDVGFIGAVSTTSDYLWTKTGTTTSVALVENLTPTTVQVTLPASAIASVGGLPLKYWVANSCRDFPFDPVWQQSDIAPDSGLYTLAGDVCPNLAGTQNGVPSGYVRIGGKCLKVTFIGTASANVMRGNAANNIMRGRGGNDRIFGLAGNDKLSGDAGADEVRGGNGRDTIVGGPGRDKLYGEGSNDTLNANDRRPGDRVVGGPGRDTCIVNVGDIVIGCERIIRR